jgi:hypothetical protein
MSEYGAFLLYVFSRRGLLISLVNLLLMLLSAVRLSCPRVPYRMYILISYRLTLKFVTHYFSSFVLLVKEINVTIVGIHYDEPIRYIFYYATLVHYYITIFRDGGPSAFVP